ncbi:MAG: phospholipid carrier-dependent glycosyltransferase [Scytonematopsis contorta HA4267-MV1]|jgi:dolichyl-phosphate-mannose--protein O-mannosyl transferase|nr:phospholipid carrier-dependent glycosyltransferase [Scytonematopsis contorta HA4267-MV1]
MMKKWFSLGMAIVFILSVALRFWGLGRFNTLVFDEVYFAKFGNNYLTGTPFFNAHPPLSQYIIGIGIWIGKRIPFWKGEVNGLAGSLLSPWSYRWMNALTGSFIPLVVAAIAYQISHRKTFAFLAGLFTACDGIFLVESRYALNNIYIVIFGLLGQWFLFLALENNSKKRSLWLIISGIFFGASAGTKWNGLWYLLGTYAIWSVAWIVKYFATDEVTDVTDEVSVGSGNKIFVVSEKPFSVKLPLQNLTQINIFQLLFYLGIIPAFVYSIIWIPHLQLDRRFGFIEVHKRILYFHQNLGGNTPDIHPYCAAWYKWPLMTRPMAYFYQTATSINEPLPIMGPPLPNGVGKIIYDVHAMGNPFLWWFGVAALLLLLVMLTQKIFIPWVQYKRFPIQSLTTTSLTIDIWIGLYLVINYSTNLLPWVRVNRCVFIYHYMTALPFVFLAIAWLVDQSLRSYYKELRIVGVTITFVILGAFIFWLPIYLGLPLTSDSYKLRMWFTSWI